MCIDVAHWNIFMVNKCDLHTHTKEDIWDEGNIKVEYVW